MSKFFILLEGATKSQKDAVTTYLMAKPWGVNHHFEDLWLLTGVPNEISAKGLCDEIRAVPGVGSQITMLVNRIADGASMTFWGRSAPANWEWMAKNWGKAG